MHFTAIFFKLLFKLSFLRSRYYGFHKKIFKPLKLFKGQTAICSYDSDLKIKADLEEWIQQHIYFLGIWDERGTNFLKLHLKPGDVFIDIGANIGSYTLVASKIVGREGKVYAFEPVSPIHEKLLFNIALNSLENIIPSKKAIFETTGTIELFLSSNENAGMSSIFHHDTESGKVEMAETVSLDEYAENEGIKRIDLIKIDIEGSEIFALKGMKASIDRFRPIIIMELSEEISSSSGIQGSDLIRFMQSHNYVVKNITTSGTTSEFNKLNSNYTNLAFFSN